MGDTEMEDLLAGALPPDDFLETFFPREFRGLG